MSSRRLHKSSVRKPASPLRILIVDDHEAIRRGIRSLLAERESYSVCGEAAGGIEAVELARQTKPDVVLMDVSMPRMDGIEATRIINRDVPESSVIIVSQNELSTLRRQTANVKVASCVSKTNLGRDLIPAIQRVAKRKKNPRRSQPTPANPEAQGPNWFEVGGEMGKRIRSFDWSKTPVGSIDRWPESLKTAVRICVGSRNPIVVWWGRTPLTQFYNDAYISFLGGKKHPAFLGRSARDCWSEIWETVAPMLDRVFSTGSATWSEDFLFVLNRNLPREEGYFTFSYSPIWGDSGKVEGIFCACYETTARVIGDRRLRTLRDLGRTVALAKTAEEACQSAARILKGNPADIPFALLYLLDDGGRRAHLAATSGLARGSEAANELIDLTSESTSVWPLRRVLESGSAEIVPNLSRRFGSLPGGPWPESPDLALMVPIPSPGQSRPAGFLVAGLSPRRVVDADYLSVFDLIVGHVSTAIANARAYEEERKRAESLAELDRAKTLFFSNVSHEFRTPLTLILGPLEDVLSARDAIAPDQRERLELAHRNSLRLLKLVNTLLDFSRIEAGRIQASYEPVDLAALTADLASVFRSAVERTGLRLIVDCPRISEPVYVDREMWEKIVFNLISNAFKFTFAGEIEIALRRADGRVELTVRDTGTGIPTEDLPHLFERFYRVKGAQGRTFEGSGIGLALVQELAKQHGGSVRAESEVGRGSSFTITVPLGTSHIPADRIGAERISAPAGARGEAYVQEALRWLPDSQSISDAIELQPRLPQPGHGASARARILLADDNADMRGYVQRLFQDRYDVIAVPDGRAALESARERRPDLVLADVMMPRLDGFGLLRALRADESLGTVPVVLVSARAGEESRIEGLRAGADDYIVKPFSARELLARVESQLSLVALRCRASELEAKLLEKEESERQALREREVRFRALVNASSFVVYRMSPDWNEMRELDGKGFVSDTPKPRRDWLQEYIHPDDRPLVLDAIRRAVLTKSMFELEHRIRRKDGTLGWAHSRAVPVMDEQGEIVEWFGAASDVTDRKETGENYRKLAETFADEVRSRTKELEERNAEISIQSNQLRALSWQLLHAQDEERRRIARELHDGAGQLLAAISMNNCAVARERERLTPKAAQRAEENVSLVEKAVSEIRTLSHLLHPPLLEEVGLHSVLSDYVHGFGARSNIRVTLDLPEDLGRLPRETELSLFRIVQECLTNIHRHSGSATASVRLLQTPTELQLEVSDEGRGVATDIQQKFSAGTSTGVGLRGMTERVRQIGGTLQIHSNGKGTSVHVVLPITEEAAHGHERSNGNGTIDARSLPIPQREPTSKKLAPAKKSSAAAR